MASSLNEIPAAKNPSEKQRHAADHRIIASSRGHSPHLQLLHFPTYEAVFALSTAKPHDAFIPSPGDRRLNLAVESPRRSYLFKAAAFWLAIAALALVALYARLLLVSFDGDYQGG